MASLSYNFKPLHRYAGFCDLTIYRAIDFAKRHRREFRRFQFDGAAFIKRV